MYSIATISLSSGDPLPVGFLMVAYLIPFAVVKISGLAAAIEDFGAIAIPLDATKATPATFASTSRRDVVDCALTGDCIRSGWLHPITPIVAVNATTRNSMHDRIILISFALILV